MADKTYGEPEVIFENAKHKCVWLGCGAPEHEQGMPSNQFLIVDEGEGYLLDPGGHYVFDRVFKNLEHFVKPEDVTGIFLSHQDPDICGAIGKWLQRLPNAQIIMSDMWIRFLMHMPIEEDPPLMPLKDEGSTVTLRSGATLRFVPAHYLHSPGNFQVYDSAAKILFSGDMGASIMPESPILPRVSDFEEHVGYLEGFHQRFLGSNAAVRFYLDNLKALNLDIEMMCPQHGGTFVGKHTVGQYLDWIGKANVGVDFMMAAPEWAK